MKFSWLLLVLAVGFLIPAQAAMNAKMRAAVLHPMYGSLVNFGIGIIVLSVSTLIMVGLGQTGNWRGAIGAPWWAWCGGIIGALFVSTAIIAIPHMGAANFSVAVIAGQLIGALVLDHFGWLNVTQHSITPPRLLGAILLLAGVWLIQRN